ncbi:fumarate hydratase [Lacticaseibacillus pantheris DSM 15945 = JCM 12539 = NBRC 106106]|uniref:Fumarate hydratase class II n=1 Tax=Lacticaseibacillus pantheris DSM 15945 = JCM 12539 = NBRC 106106 TaxID=1423783 RepID=A0A0R1TWU9_9LACO|nr:class II fumarate hydratase [Lacticaseibacillus pantheris]KRL85670.1 fumarate hydratase [Lacticaseibacillus pantheris DSM 15945 = JCM 12539 = NBRC 106106]
MRIENDAIGAVEIPDDVWWGPQTERSRHNFAVGPDMPLPVIRALIEIKRAAAKVNGSRGNLEQPIADGIVQVASALLTFNDHDLRSQFPLKVYQTGSGTQTNMNVNEVIAHQASKAAGTTVLANDHVNQGQSSNDTFPTAMHMAAYAALGSLVSTIQHTVGTMKTQEQQYHRTVKLGRTHLQDATPITFGQEVSGWRATLEQDIRAITAARDTLRALPLGGTAVGTGLNTTPAATKAIITQLISDSGVAYTSMTNKFHGLSAHTELTNAHAAVKTLATDLMKIANDIRFLASGPRGGYGELTIPTNEPGSSIMPGKVNPTQAEALTMIATRVMGNDVTISVANSQGNFEMNVYKPIIIATLLESITLLRGGLDQFNRLLLTGLTANADRMRADVDGSLMTVTALSPHIGYEVSARIAQHALRDGTTLREAALKSGKVTAAQFDEWADPLQMTRVDD